MPPEYLAVRRRSGLANQSAPPPTNAHACVHPRKCVSAYVCCVFAAECVHSFVWRRAPNCLRRGLRRRARTPVRRRRVARLSHLFLPSPPTSWQTLARQIVKAMSSYSEPVERDATTHTVPPTSRPCSARSTDSLNGRWKVRATSRMKWMYVYLHSVQCGASSQSRTRPRKSSHAHIARAHTRTIDMHAHTHARARPRAHTHTHARNQRTDGRTPCGWT
jgi:hypothetical protein